MSVVNEPILCLPYAGVAEQLSGMAHDLQGSGFQADLNCVGPMETARWPEYAAHVRLSILLRVYGGDYHTDSFDVERIAARMRRGAEAVWFWGSAREVARLRDLAATGSADAAPNDLMLGTVSLLGAEEEFGPGYGELCRSGSTDRELGAKLPIIARTMGYLSGSESRLCASYHTLVLTPRNRAPAPGVSGGQPIQRIHKRYVRSRFWGFAPFYVMQGGGIEQTEFRESNRAPDDVLTALRESTPWFFADPLEAAYAQALCKLSFSESPPIELRNGRAQARGVVRVVTPPQGLEETNRGCMFRDEHAEGHSLVSVGAALERLEQVRVCSSVARLRLDDPAEAGTQAWLVERGFRLTAVVPPKRTWLERSGAKRALRLPPYGLWTRPRADLTVVPPFYLQEEGRSEPEAEILNYLRARLNWPSELAAVSVEANP